MFTWTVNSVCIASLRVTIICKLVKVNAVRINCSYGDYRRACAGAPAEELAALADLRWWYQLTMHSATAWVWPLYMWSEP